MDQIDDKTEKLVTKIRTSNHALTVYRSNVLLRTLGVLTAIICVILLAFLGALSIVRSNGSFTIDIPDNDSEIQLTLSKTVGFEEPTTRISFDSSQELDNISYKDLPQGLDSADGDHCGENFLAYTFYIKNVGEYDAIITATLLRTDVVKNSDQAIRVRMYVNGNYNTYAMIGANGEPEFDNPVSFVDDTNIYQQEYTLKPGEVKKYTIVIWLEGDDPECIDNIKGGFVKLKMTFSGRR